MLAREAEVTVEDARPDVLVRESVVSADDAADEEEPEPDKQDELPA